MAMKWPLYAEDSPGYLECCEKISNNKKISKWRQFG